VSEPLAARIDETIDRALAGDEASLRELEAWLPLARARVRERLADKPNARGAAALRLILVGYDE